MFSKACEYALKVMIYVSSHDEEERRIGVKEIAEAISSPEAFTAKILQQLVRAQLLSSFKGPSGGFTLMEGVDIRMLDVVLAIDGSKILDHCVLGLAECSSSQPCPVHDSFSVVRDKLKETLVSTNIRDNSLWSSTMNLR